MKWKLPWDKKVIPDPVESTRPVDLTPDNKIRRGLRAQALLSDQLIKEAMQETLLVAHRQFEAAVTDADLRAARDLLQSAYNFLQYLRGIVTVGQAESGKIRRAQNTNSREPVLAGLRQRN